MRSDSAISLDGTEDGRLELGVMNGIGMRLALKAEAVEAFIARAVFALERRGRSGGIDLWMLGWSERICITRRVPS
jgi:hypothetical protein